MKVNNALYLTYESYREAWANASTVTPPVPLNLDLELSTFCNLKCGFCYQSDPAFAEFMDGRDAQGQKRRRFMDTNLAIGLINRAAMMGIPAIKFNGRGESTMHPDYARIIFHAKQVNAFHDLLINTNGMIPALRADCLCAIMAASKAVVSLDSTVAATYERIRCGVSFGTVVENIRRLIDMGHRNLWIRRVACVANRDEAYAAGCRLLFGSEGYHIAEHAVFDRGADKITARLGERVYCAQPSQRLFCTADGVFLACCNDTVQAYPVGLAKDGIEAAWNGKAMQELRNSLKGCPGCASASCWPMHCENCTSWISYNNPNRALLADKEIK